jgi:hypothetical protein
MSARRRGGVAQAAGHTIGADGGGAGVASKRRA